METTGTINSVEISTLAFDITEKISKLLSNHDTILDIEDDKEIYNFLVKILKKYE